ncbi:hypothetical protein DPMN_015760 [Dreissena polymorpha]|uniref:Uncharacterized protein n=1 Tax=Dreissena polymorpha TaxID=45954 RepID=A0A9D4NC22_DREPO|nr:hypothetical protein DPMN_015760 [Dreissena polymorpha]
MYAIHNILHFLSQELESLLSDHSGRTPANSEEIHEKTSEDRDEQSDFPLQEECEVVIWCRAWSYLSSVDQDSAE